MIYGLCLCRSDVCRFVMIGRGQRSCVRPGGQRQSPAPGTRSPAPSRAHHGDGTAPMSDRVRPVEAAEDLEPPRWQAAQAQRIRDRLDQPPVEHRRRDALGALARHRHEQVVSPLPHNNSPLKHADWDAFRDPDEVGLPLLQRDAGRAPRLTWTACLPRSCQERPTIRRPRCRLGGGALARLYTPTRYPLHCLQMGSAYLCADRAGEHHRELRDVPGRRPSCAGSRASAYRTKELADAHAGAGFVTGERKAWEEDACWQGFRALLERVLVAYDWAGALRRSQRRRQACVRRGVHPPAGPRGPGRGRHATRADAGCPVGRQRARPPLDRGARRLRS